MAVVSLVETKSTPVGQLGMQFKLVEPSSAGTFILKNSFVKYSMQFQFSLTDLGVGEMHFIPTDHMDICKPLNKYADYT